MFLAVYVHRFMGDATWSQAPIIVMPHDALQRLREPWASTAERRKQNRNHRAKWMELRGKLRQCFVNHDGFHEADTYISALIEGTCDVGAALPDLAWHREVEPVLPAIIHVPASLQGALAPCARFRAAWRA